MVGKASWSGDGGHGQGWSGVGGDGFACDRGARSLFLISEWEHEFLPSANGEHL